MSPNLVRVANAVTAMIAVAWALQCSEGPLDPGTPSQRQLTPADTTSIQVPEEEIFGTVLQDKFRVTSSGFAVRLTVQNNDGCLFGLDSQGNPTACQTTATMPVMTRGSRVGFADHMWGWYNDLDSDNNPCNTTLVFARRERHDLNNNGIRDETGPEKGPELHCLKPGKYKVELINGVVQRSRIVEHRLTKNTVATPDGFNKDIEDASGTGASDTFVHFDIGSEAYAITSGTNVVQIDNPNTSALFAAADTLTDPNIRMRFNSPVTTQRVKDVPGKRPPHEPRLLRLRS